MNNPSKIYKIAQSLVVAALFSSAAYAEEYVSDRSQLLPLPLQSGPYMGVRIGPAFLSGDGSSWFNTGFGIGAQFGYRLDKLRVEGEFTYFRNTADDPSATLELTTYMVNGYYDFYFSDKIVPFIGGGMGIAHSFSSTRANNIVLNENTENELAYQLLGGIGYQIQPKTMLELRYRYLAFSDHNDTAQNAIEIGVSYKF